MHKNIKKLSKATAETFLFFVIILGFMWFITSIAGCYHDTESLTPQKCENIKSIFIKNPQSFLFEVIKDDKITFKEINSKNDAEIVQDVPPTELMWATWGYNKYLPHVKNLIIHIRQDTEIKPGAQQTKFGTHQLFKIN